ncbi:MAG: hypothetical protein E7494_13955 [Ruminococcus albus]|jgi:hypothetical protein|nr:hypothetical protein [Ruminococcus albus]
MQCYKIKFTLDTPLPLEEGKRKRRDIDDEAINLIQNSLNDINIVSPHTQIKQRNIDKSNQI